MKTHIFYLVALILGTMLFIGNPALGQSTGLPLANNVEDDNRSAPPPFAEERMAVQAFIDNINEARTELSMKQVDLAHQKVIMARNLLPLIARATPAQRRLTRVEFGGGFYADDLSQRKSYAPIETQSLEELSRNAGPRWTKSTRSESNAKIIYIRLDLEDGKATAYLNQAEKFIAARDFKNAEIQLAEISDQVIKIDDKVPVAIQARDYMTLADNYIVAHNFFGARSSLGQSSQLLERMKNDDAYKIHRHDIIELHKKIGDLQIAFAKLDAEQIKTAGTHLKMWQEQLASWAKE